MSTVLDNEVEQILKGRKPAFGQFCKMDGGLTLASQSKPYFDESKMSATAVINTPREDREGDIIIPMGVRLDNYRANPVVLWEHGLGSIDIPIAKCMTPEDELALEITEDEIIGTSYFTDTVPESLQIFHLITSGIVRATSVRAEPVKYKTHRTEAGDMGMTLEEWELVEWSWGCMGVNPDAVAKILEKGTIEGDKISLRLLKSLKAVAPKPTEFFKGLCIPKEKAVADEPINPEEKPTDDPAVKTKADMPEEPTTDDEIPVEDLERMDDMMMEEDDANTPTGAKVLRSAYTSLKTLKAELEAAAGPLEQPEVKELVNELVENVSGMQQAIDGLHSKTYTEMDPLSKMDDPKGDEMAEAAMKSLSSWMTKGVNKHRLLGIRNDIRKVAYSKGLNKHQRNALIGVFKSIQRVESEAKNHKPEVSVEQFDALTAQVDTLMDKLADVIPQ